MKFSEIQTQLTLEGYSKDEVSIDKTLAEQRNCSQGRCGGKLIYHGLSNGVTYRAYGVCERCESYRIFRQNTHEFARAKKSFSKAGK